MRHDKARPFIEKNICKLMPELANSYVFIDTTNPRSNFCRLHWTFYMSEEHYVEHKNKKGFIDCSAILRDGRIFQIFQHGRTSKKAILELLEICKKRLEEENIGGYVA